MKKYIVTLGSALKIIVLLIFISAGFTSELSASTEDLKTTIILINGQAALVDLNPKGEILKRYIAVPDYFTSYRSHESLVRRSIERAKSMRDIGYKAFDSKNHELSYQVNKELENIRELADDWEIDGPFQLNNQQIEQYNTIGLTTSHYYDQMPMQLWPSRKTKIAEMT